VIRSPFRVDPPNHALEVPFDSGDEAVGPGGAFVLREYLVVGAAIAYSVHLTSIKAKRMFAITYNKLQSGRETIHNTFSARPETKTGNVETALVRRKTI